MKKLLISFAAALLLASCGGGGNNQAAQNNDNTAAQAPKQETKVATTPATTAEPTAKTDATNIYVAATNANKTTVYKNNEPLYTYDGSFRFLFVVDGHVYYGIEPTDDEGSCKVYADGKATNLTFGPDVSIWKGEKDIFFDECNGKIVNQKGETVFTYKPDEDGSPIVRDVAQQGDNIYVLINRGYDSEPSELYKNGKLIENETGAYSMYGLRIINGDAYCRGFDFWQGQAQSPVISKNMKPVLGGFKPEGSFWISDNGDIYTSEPDEEYSEDDDFTYLLVSKNGKNPKKVKGYPEDSFNMAADGNDVYYWSFAGALDAYIYKNFVETATIQYPKKSGSAAHYMSKMKDGHLYAAIVDFEDANTVTLYKDSTLLKSYPAHLSQEEGLDCVIADFTMEIE